MPNMRMPVQVVYHPGLGHSVSCRLLPGCRAVATDRASAVREFLRAANGYLAAAGNFVPEQPHRLFELPAEMSSVQGEGRVPTIGLRPIRESLSLL
jgi:hypothetical protein